MTQILLQTSSSGFPPKPSNPLVPPEEFVRQERKLDAEGLVNATTQRRLWSIDCDECRPGEDDAFFVADLGEVYRREREWRAKLSRVQPFYAVKCNSDPRVLRLLAALERGFDCASTFANLCKTKSALRFARPRGVAQMTFDNADELHKIQQVFRSAELHLRISVSNPSALVDLSEKFGATPDSRVVLLKLAKRLELNVVGVSFHVWTGGASPESFTRAVRE